MFWHQRFCLWEINMMKNSSRVQFRNEKSTLHHGNFYSSSQNLSIEKNLCIKILILNRHDRKSSSVFQNFYHRKHFSERFFDNLSWPLKNLLSKFLFLQNHKILSEKFLLIKHFFIFMSKISDIISFCSSSWWIFFDIFCFRKILKRNFW